jgi:hypothetical protein
MNQPQRGWIYDSEFKQRVTAFRRLPMGRGFNVREDGRWVFYESDYAIKSQEKYKGCVLKIGS